MNSLRISSATKKFDNPFIQLCQSFVNLLICVYKGTSNGGGVIQAKGLVGTWEVQTKVASLGCVCKRSSV